MYGQPYRVGYRLITISIMMVLSRASFDMVINPRKQSIGIPAYGVAIPVFTLMEFSASMSKCCYNERYICICGTEIKR